MKILRRLVSPWREHADKQKAIIDSHRGWLAESEADLLVTLAENDELRRKLKQAEDRSTKAENAIHQAERKAENAEWEAKSAETEAGRRQDKLESRLEWLRRDHQAALADLDAAEELLGEAADQIDGLIDGLVNIIGSVMDDRNRYLDQLREVARVAQS